MIEPLLNTIKARISFSDEEVINSIRGIGNADAVNWFLKNTQVYAFGTWQKKFPRLQDEDWKIIWSDVHFKLIKRIKGGLTLQAGTKLSSYYTTIVGYAILDHLKEQKDTQVAEITSTIIGLNPDLPAYHFEAEQIAISIKNMLVDITKNEDQVQVMLLFSKGYSYKEIVLKTNYKSEGACRNAYGKAKKKVAEFILAHPQKGQELRKLLSSK